MIKKTVPLLAAFFIASGANANDTTYVSQGTKGGVVRTNIETWNLSDDEKKNSFKAVMTSSMSGSAIAPSRNMRTGEWDVAISQHKACFYNAYVATVAGKYSVMLEIVGQQVKNYGVITVGGGQGLCITKYLQMWIRPNVRGQIPTLATTHTEMDGEMTDNTGSGIITAR